MKRAALALAVLLAGCASDKPRPEPLPEDPDRRLLVLLRDAWSAHKRLQADPSLEKNGDFRAEADARVEALRPLLSKRYDNLLRGGLLLVLRQPAAERARNARVLGSRIEKFGLASVRVFEERDDLLLLVAPWDDRFEDFVQTRLWLLARGHLEFCVESPDGTAGADRIVVPWDREPLVLMPPFADSAAVVSASASGPEVRITLADDAAAEMKRVTSENPGRRLAILVDRKVIVAPKIQATVSKEAVITGPFTEKETARLAILLQLGPLSGGLKAVGEVPVAAAKGGDPFAGGPSTQAWNTLMSTPVGMALLEDVIGPNDPELYREAKAGRRP